MANANPSRSGGNLNTATSKMEISIPKEQKVGIYAQGDTVRRTIMQNGNVLERHVFAGDHPDAKPFPKAKAQKED